MRQRVAVSILILSLAAILILRDQATAARMDLDLSALRASAANLLGSAMPRDRGGATTPSLNSDRLEINLSGVQSPPAGFDLQAYLLDGNNGAFCGTLTVNNGNVNAVKEFDDRNLVQSYNSFRLMWERSLFETTTPDAALTYLRQVLTTVAGTPQQVGYGVGMVREARTLLEHASLAAGSPNLAGARLHTEHVLNILYGKADPRHQDYDGNGAAENPGDGFGLLPYVAGVDLAMTYAAESEGRTEHIFQQSLATLTTLGNFAPADGDGTWADLVVAQAHQVLAAGTIGAARTPVDTMRDLAAQILNGTDANSNGTVEPIAGEGGVWTAYAAAQGAADFLPSGAITGSVRHVRAGNNPTSDRLVISLDNVPQPPSGFQVWGYLIGPNDNRLVLGQLPWNNGKVETTLTYANRNLIGEFHGLQLVHASIYAQDTLPTAPLTPIRTILGTSNSTPGNVGYGVGLVQQAQILRTLAEQASAAASFNNLPLAQQRAKEALNVLVGEDDPRYQPDAANPGDGFGVLVYAARLDLSMQQAAANASATVNMIQRSDQARAAVANFAPAIGGGTWSDELISQIQQILAAQMPDAATVPASQAATLADRILNGQGDLGGARAAYLASQQSADYFPLEAGATQPGENPVPGPNPDAFENDDLCSRARIITTDGVAQRRTFHYDGDQDWVRFTAQANKSYVIDVIGVGNKADPVIFLFDTCGAAPGAFENNTFGNSVRLIWNSTKNGTYYMQLRQFDPADFGPDTEYDLRVTVDETPPSPPTNLRCLAIDQNTLALQWRRSPELDVKQYRVSYANENQSNTGIINVDGADTTFVQLGGLTHNELFNLSVTAVDFSNNQSAPAGPLPCRPVQPTDATQPVIGSLSPSFSAIYTTTAPLLTFSGTAQDAGNNLSRVRVRNSSVGQEKTDFTLSGGAAEFRVEDIPIRVGVNNVQVTVFDEANNSSSHNMVINRLAEGRGAAIIVAGHNETFGLQTNIYNAANRAYRIFLSAGFSADDIYYLAPVAQDATGDGTPNTRNLPLSPAAVQEAITGWAKDKVGDGKPLFIYLMDHGFADRYCVTGCTPGNVISPAELDTWLRNLEDTTGVNEVNIFIEACESGSFLDNLPDPSNSLARQNRVVITSTSRDKNAYASTDGAIFSDTFFSCLADSGTIKACFDEASVAVAITGVQQEPWLDDNADGVPNSGDGTVASSRTLTRFFSSVRPRILETEVTRSGNNGVLTARVEAGAESLRLVWAAVYAPSFTEPTTTTLNLNVPVVRLEPVPDDPGLFRFNYTNGFTEPGDYRVIFYAQDRLGINATPRRFGAVEEIYLPVVNR
ncbi:MAG: fibronectin type III domain-containing protein [Caldilineaceae bacterium]|nr:fibronectin type III domain-containing protein [Caldilineaceae bacterium]